MFFFTVSTFLLYSEHPFFLLCNNELVGGANTREKKVRPESGHRTSGGMSGGLHLILGLNVKQHGHNPPYTFLCDPYTAARQRNMIALEEYERLRANTGTLLRYLVSQTRAFCLT